MGADFPAGKYRSYGSSDGTGWVIAGIVAVAVLVLISIVFHIGNVSHHETKQGCAVIDKDRTKDSKGNSDMRVYTTNCGTLQVADTLVGGAQFDSADIYASIEVGKTYDFYVRGKRYPLFSMFPIIQKVTPVS
jgi:hypothetical protein